MDAIQAMADLSIRRACGFAGLAICCVMLGLSYEPTLSFRTGAQLVALFCFGLAFAAWRAPRRDMRHTELWSLLAAHESSLLRDLPRNEAQALLARTLQDRLMWHAERVALTAIGLWVIAVISGLLNLLLGA